MDDFEAKRMPNAAPGWRDHLRRLVDGPQPHEIVAYRGYGEGTRVLVHGRALECANIPVSSATDSTWRNLLSTYKRIDAAPLAHARIAVRMGADMQEIAADSQGFFRHWLELPASLRSDEPWRRTELQLITPLRPDQPIVRTHALARVPGSSSAFGVISDLDDTVIQSRVSNLVQAIRTVMLGNARTRLPFPGVAAFYRALERGGSGVGHNPIFYVSSSPWNLYDLIAEFMELQRIPTGPICLRDWDLGLSALSHQHLTQHKEPLIREILDLYPALPFILIGDSSQRDPEIYRAILDRYPSRILAIYIRNVDPNPERLESMRRLAADVLAAGSSLILADDTFAAAKHAADHGWIAANALPAVHTDTSAPTIIVE